MLFVYFEHLLPDFTADRAELFEKLSEFNFRQVVLDDNRNYSQDRREYDLRVLVLIREVSEIL